MNCNISHNIERQRNDKAAGFTLIEVMLVVVIVAVLAAVGLVAFRRHLRSGRIVKAEQFISEIKGRQELYARRHGVYGAAPVYPALAGANEPKAKLWGVAPTPAIPAAWKELGARPPGGASYFQFQVVASAGPSHGLTGSAAALGIQVAANAADRRPWYYIVALGDLDGDGCNVGAGIAAPNCTVITTTSLSSSIVVRNRGE